MIRIKSNLAADESPLCIIFVSYSFKNLIEERITVIKPLRKM